MVVVGQEGASHMVILGFAFPLEAGSFFGHLAWRQQEAEAHKNERVLSIRGGTFNSRVLLIQRMI